MILDVRSYRLNWQLYHLYDGYPDEEIKEPWKHYFGHYRFDMLYDFVEKEHNPAFEQTDKEYYWEYAKKWTKPGGNRKEEAVKLYKTLLIRDFLLKKLYFEGVKLDFTDENGVKIPRINFGI